MTTGQPFKGPPVDMWAAGITLFMFLFGRPPFTAPTVTELYEVIQTAPLEFPSSGSGAGSGAGAGAGAAPAAEEEVRPADGAGGSVAEGAAEGAAEGKGNGGLFDSAEDGAAFQSLMRGLLERDADARLTPAQAGQHAWLHPPGCADDPDYPGPWIPIEEQCPSPETCSERSSMAIAHS